MGLETTPASLSMFHVHFIIYRHLLVRDHAVCAILCVSHATFAVAAEHYAAVVVEVVTNVVLAVYPQPIVTINLGNSSHIQLATIQRGV